MPISPARVAAFQILLRVEAQDAYAPELLHAENVSRLSALDRNLAMQIVMGTLRWQSNLDDELRRFATGKNNVAKLDAEVRVTLRMALFQLRFLDRIPPSAAVNDSVELVKRAKKRSAAPFVNAVLRKVASAPGDSSTDLSDAKGIAAGLAHPLWLVERWVEAFGLESTRRICDADQATPTTTLRYPLGGDAAKALDDQLHDAGIILTPGKLMTNARRVVSGDAAATSAFRERCFAIQDEASQLVAALVGRGQRILDCCAAPGGKTQAIAQRNPEAEIVAIELHPQRARMMRELATAKNVEVVAADVTALKTEKNFDRVLADVPCSGTGTLARNPEIKWRLRPEDLIDLHQRQVRILNAALDHAATGARVVYSTCSLEKEEDEQVVEESLAARDDVRLIPVKDVLQELQKSGELAWRDLDPITSGPFLQTLPGVHPCDGFFAATFEKISG